MTIEELLQQNSHLHSDEAKTGVYLVPSGKFGYTAFPVGAHKNISKEIKRDLSSDFVIPDNISQEEKHRIEFYTQNEQVFELDPNAVLLTADEYIGITTRTHCFTKDLKAVIPYVMSDSEILLSEKRDELHFLKEDIDQILVYLASKDYIGNKISTALTEEKRDEYRKLYAKELEHCEELRMSIDPKQEHVEILRLEIAQLEEVVVDENK